MALPTRPRPFGGWTWDDLQQFDDDGHRYEIVDGSRRSARVAYAEHPARFRHRPPQPPVLPTAAWINNPQREALIQNP